MGFTLPTANKGGDAPEVEAGLAVLRFDGLRLVTHEDWAGTDKFGKPDDGSRFHFDFTLMEEDGKGGYQVVYDPDSEGDPIELEALTRTATGEKSGFAAILGGILTSAEMVAWRDATEDEPFDGDSVLGRLVHGQIDHKEKSGWPYVKAVVGQVKAKKGGAK